MGSANYLAYGTNSYFIFPVKRALSLMGRASNTFLSRPPLLAHYPSHRSGGIGPMEKILTLILRGPGIKHSLPMPIRPVFTPHCYPHCCCHLPESSQCTTKSAP